MGRANATAIAIDAATERALRNLGEVEVIARARDFIIQQASTRREANCRPAGDFARRRRESGGGAECQKLRNAAGAPVSARNGALFRRAASCACCTRSRSSANVSRARRLRI